MIQTYSLDRGGAPLYEQLYRALKADILSGVLPGGGKLPSGRALSEHLGVSRVTVETAYAQLLAEGYVTSRERAGYFVEAVTPAAPPLPEPEPAAPDAPEPSAAQTPPARQFPFSVWARLMRGVLLDFLEHPDAWLARGGETCCKASRMRGFGRCVRRSRASCIVSGASACRRSRSTSARARSIFTIC